MTRFLTAVLFNAAALWITATFLHVFTVTSVRPGETYADVLTYLALGLLLAAINTLLMPIVKIVTIPLYILTLGLWSVVVNGIALWLLGVASVQLGWGVHLTEFWWETIWAAFVLGIVNWLVSLVARMFGVSAK